MTLQLLNTGVEDFPPTDLYLQPQKLFYSSTTAFRLQAGHKKSSINLASDVVEAGALLLCQRDALFKSASSELSAVTSLFLKSTTLWGIAYVLEEFLNNFYQKIIKLSITVGSFCP